MGFVRCACANALPAFLSSSCVCFFFISYFFLSKQLYGSFQKAWLNCECISDFMCVCAASLTVFTKTSSHICSHTNYPIHSEINAFASHKSRTCSSAALCFFYLCSVSLISAMQLSTLTHNITLWRKIRNKSSFCCQNCARVNCYGQVSVAVCLNFQINPLVKICCLASATH